MNPRPWWRRLGHWGLVLVATVYCAFPIYFMFVQSLKTAQEDVFGNPLIVVNPTFENFEELFERKSESVRVDGDLAIIMGAETVRPTAGAPMAGQTIQRRFTNIWRRGDRTWRLYARHANVLPAR